MYEKPQVASPALQHSGFTQVLSHAFRHHVVATEQSNVQDFGWEALISSCSSFTTLLHTGRTFSPLRQDLVEPSLPLNLLCI